MDYPILSTAPQTTFSCSDKVDGYYADQEAQCQVPAVSKLDTKVPGAGLASVLWGQELDLPLS